MRPKSPGPAEGHPPHGLRDALRRRVAWYAQAQDPGHDPRNDWPELRQLRVWQARRLAHSFRSFLEHPKRGPAARFFLADLYGADGFAERDRQALRVLPAMSALLPGRLLQAAVHALELGVLTQALDLRMAGALRKAGVRRPGLAAYGQAYRRVGRPRLRRRQIDLILAVGRALEESVQHPAAGALLRAARLPAALAGLGQLQGFLERGFEAFRALGADAGDFLVEIERHEREASRRLLAGHPRPFG
jgi:hypothetical protein